MKIIVDGNDGVGKSTTAKILQDEFGINSYIHFSYKDPSDFDFYNRILEKDNVIFDRSFLDDIIYAEVLGREPRLTQEEVDRLIEKAKELGFIFIICHTTKNKYNKDEHKEIKNQKEKLDNYFEDLAKKHNFKYYDPMNESIIDLLKYLERLVEK